MTTREFKLPDPGEGLVEAEIVTWRVAVGDEIKINDIVVEIETSKSLVELPSPYAGEVTALLVPEGETVPVGTPIIRIGAEDAAPAGGSAATPTPEAEMEIDLSNPAASGGGEGESLVGRNKADRGPTRRVRRAAPGAAVANAQAQAAFDHLAGLERPFAPLPEDVVCSQQYGGPETARVLGRWGGEPVELDLSRVDGCRIAQWDSLVPVVPATAS